MDWQEVHDPDVLQTLNNMCSTDVQEVMLLCCFAK